MTKADAAASSGVPDTASEGSPNAAPSAPSGAASGLVLPALSEADKLPAHAGSGGDEHLAAVTSLSSEALSNIDTTLDQLTTATDLFDVPAFDLDG